MMRILLMPSTNIILKVDVVAKCLFLASPKVRLFPLEPLVFPIFIERHCFRYAHGINQISSPVSLLAASTDDPISHGANPANCWLASS